MDSSLKSLQNYLREEHIDLAYIDSPSSIAYFTHYISEPMERILALIVTPDHSLLFTPALEVIDAKKVTTTDTVIGYHDEENPWQLMLDWSKGVHADSPQRVGVDKNSLTVLRQEALDNIWSPEFFEHIGSQIDQMRLIKTPDEIEKLHEAGRIADKAVRIGMDALRVGISEQEVVAAIEFEMKKMGVSEMSFPTIVLFGDHAASPHGEPGSRQLQENELVLFDLGVLYNGYASDMTRTVAFGQVSQELKDIYHLVLEAQTTAEKNAHIGMLAKDLDLTARDIISDAGYGEYFNHRLGHGIGQTAHEYPSLHSQNTQELLEGMCFSIEPGIYIEDKVGVRIEDCYVLTENGVESFTHTPKDWTELPIKY